LWYDEPREKLQPVTKNFGEHNSRVLPAVLGNEMQRTKTIPCFAASLARKTKALLS